MNRNGRRAALLRLAGLCGMVTPVATLALILAAVRQSSWFSWTADYLSDLGARGDYQALFNLTLVGSGLLLMGFAAGLSHGVLGGQGWGRGGCLLLAAMALALVATGAFPAPTGARHVVAAAAFFTLMPVSLLAVGVGFMLLARRRLAWLTLATAGATSLIEITPWPWEGGAIVETLSLLPLALWLIVLGAVLVHEAGQGAGIRA